MYQHVVAMQARQSSGQVQSAALESSRANWQLSPLGLPGQLEEQDIRVPPLPPGKSFSDCYEVLQPPFCFSPAFNKVCRHACDIQARDSSFSKLTVEPSVPLACRTATCQL